jgi:hypothetical protein
MAPSRGRMRPRDAARGVTTFSELSDRVAHTMQSPPKLKTGGNLNYRPTPPEGQSRAIDWSMYGDLNSQQKRQLDRYAHGKLPGQTGMPSDPIPSAREMDRLLHGKGQWSAKPPQAQRQADMGAMDRRQFDWVRNPGPDNDQMIPAPNDRPSAPRPDEEFVPAPKVWSGGRRVY